MASRCKGSQKFPPQMPPPAPDVAQTAGGRAGEVRRTPSPPNAPPSAGRTECADIVYADDWTQMYGSLPRDHEFLFGRNGEPASAAPAPERRGLLRCKPIRFRRPSNSPERAAPQVRSLLAAALKQTASGALSAPVALVAPTSLGEPRPAYVGGQVSRSPSSQRTDAKRSPSTSPEALDAAAFLAGSPGAEACFPNDPSLLQRYRVEL